MKKLENFLAAYENLRDIYDYEEPYSNVEMTGMVGLYEICFEQSWKAMKEYLHDQGLDEARTGSPKRIIKLAYECGLITEEQDWLDALADRNNVAHAYNRDVALQIIDNTKHKYYALFKQLIDAMTDV